jgi:hypothetical protein
MKSFCLTLILLFTTTLSVAGPTVSNVRATQRTDGSGIVDVYYDLSGGYKLNENTIIDNFNGNPIAFEPRVSNPADVSTGNSTWTDNFDYSTISNPTLPSATGGDGRALRTASNNVDGVKQINYQLFGNASDDEYAVEAMAMPYLGTDNTGGGTTWGGIGLRVTAPYDPGTGQWTDGYFIQMRPDNSPSFGNYVNFWKSKGGVGTFLGRYYFVVGSGGVTESDADAQDGGSFSGVIRDPQSPNTNQWIPLRMEAVNNATGARISLYIEDLDTPVTTFDDDDPVTSGKALIFHEDPFSSLTEPPDTTAMLFEYFKVETWDSAVEEWKQF